MSVLLETSVGDLVIDLFVDECPKTTLNFLKLCKIKFYNNCLFYEVQRDYLVSTGDPTNKGSSGTSVWGVASQNPKLMYFDDEIRKNNRKFDKKGLVAMANKGPNMNGSAFFITLSDNEIEHLNNKHTIFGQIVEGLENLDKINKAYTDSKGRPYQNIRIKHTLVIDDPYEDQDPEGLVVPSRSPSPVVIRSKDLGQDEYLDEDFDERLEDDIDLNEIMKGKTEEDLQKEIIEHQTKTRAAVLEIVEDLPDADIEPPKNVLFVCKLNPVTQDGDLNLIFSRFGPIKTCEIIRDWKTGDSLQYAFIEFETEEACIEAYTRMEGVAIDERRIHVDFSQSVAKLWNSHRKKQLKIAADKILEHEEILRDKEKKVYNLFNNYKDKDNGKKKSRSRDRETRRDRDDRHYKYKDDRSSRRDRSRSKDGKHKSSHRDDRKHIHRDRSDSRDRKQHKKSSHSYRRERSDSRDKKSHRR
ncbi:peptidylprolyl isomerase-like 4 [Stylonychia lemnae]|uniref:Peptidyl-prolyl cis-trans isomerase n=1 Tax=Stylonychia lemnae TaxID=5949 RepID=A0A078B6Z2_STYLE|nr:peptidylprolyl isomerase-like 4 [Stylonychia lemnae]|eukprot:CDW89961.1 peptidylprolyl isomerase-like 4 [Stylonychia lemnae]